LDDFGATEEYVLLAIVQVGIKDVLTELVETVLDDRDRLASQHALVHNALTLEKDHVAWHHTVIWTMHNVTWYQIDAGDVELLLCIQFFVYSLDNQWTFKPGYFANTVDVCNDVIEVLNNTS
jgi:hypothetical protein